MTSGEIGDLRAALDEWDWEAEHGSTALLGYWDLIPIVEAARNWLTYLESGRKHEAYR